MDRLVSNHGLSHLALHILSYVEMWPNNEINNCRLVCKDWQALIDSDIAIAKRRLNYLLPRRFMVKREWKDFKEAHDNTMKCKNLEQVKKLNWCFETYLKDTGPLRPIVTSPDYLVYSPIHWFAKSGSTTIVMFFASLVSSLNEKAGIVRKEGIEREDKSTFALACSNGHTSLVKALIEASKTIDIDLNARDWIGETGFMGAARHGHYEVVKLISEKSEEYNIDLNARCPGGFSAFTTALHFDASKETLDLFLQNKSIQLNLIDEYGESSFTTACKYYTKSTNVIHHLLENSEELGIDLNYFDEANSYARTGFLDACIRGNFETVKIIAEYCIRTGTVLSTFDPRGLNAISIVCKVHKSIRGSLQPRRVLEYLLENSPRIESILHFGQTLNANQTDDDGRTPLMHAVLMGREDLLPVFFDYATKIDFNHRDSNGHNVLLMPTIEHDYEADGYDVCEYYYESGALDLLLQNVRRFGIEANIRIPLDNGHWTTTFHQYCLGLNVKVLKILLDHTEDVVMDYNATDSKGQTGFMKACEKGLHLNVECLILNSQKIKLDLNATDDNWMTGYMLACKNRNALVVETMLQHSAEYDIDLNATDKQGRNGFDLWNSLRKSLPFPGTEKYVEKKHLFLKKNWPPNFNEE